MQNPLKPLLVRSDGRWSENASSFNKDRNRAGHGERGPTFRLPTGTEVAETAHEQPRTKEWFCPFDVVRIGTAVSPLYLTLLMMLIMSHDVVAGVVADVGQKRSLTRERHSFPPITEIAIAI